MWHTSTPPLTMYPEPRPPPNLYDSCHFMKVKTRPKLHNKHSPSHSPIFRSHLFLHCSQWSRIEIRCSFQGSLFEAQAQGSRCDWYSSSKENELGSLLWNDKCKILLRHNLRLPYLSPPLKLAALTHRWDKNAELVIRVGLAEHFELAALQHLPVYNKHLQILLSCTII